MGARSGEFVLSEAPGTLSREAVVIASGAGVLQPGTVLGQLTDGGKYVPYDDDHVDASGNADGREAAVGILLEGVDATSADQDAVILTRLAEVVSAKLVWHADNDATDKSNGLADLAARYILARS
jgi:hypothetical protein